MSKLGRGALGAIVRAAIWLPFFFGAAVLGDQRMWAQTTGLPPAVSGDCSVSAAGVVTCTKAGGTSFAASATVDATNAGNIVSGSLPAARMATALASPTAIGMTAPNLGRFASDNNSTQNFTQWFTATNAAGAGTQPGSTGITAGSNCQGFWVVVTGTTLRAFATCFDNTSGVSWYTAASATFGSESWSKVVALTNTAAFSLLGGTATFQGRNLAVSSPASPAANFALVDFSSGARLRGMGGSTTTYGATSLQSETSNGTVGASFICAGAVGAGTTAGSCTASVNLIQPLYTPASSTESCTAGKTWEDANFHYVCTAANTIKRVALTTF